MKSRNCRLFITGVLFLATVIADADTVTLKSGRTIEGNVIQRDTDNVVILADYGTTSVPATIVESVAYESDKTPVTHSSNTVSTDARIPEWRTTISKLASQSWAYKLRQIPATVVTNGVMRNVPYISFRCGIDYEVNIYGDLDNPAGVEIGFYRSLLDEGRKEYATGIALGFMNSILPRPSDRSIVNNLNHEKDSQTADGLTFEVTPETADDAYGGWWISVYNEKALDQARVSDTELKNISILNSAIIKESDPVESGNVWTKDDLKYARPVAVPVPQPTTIAPSAVPTPDAGAISEYPDVAPEHNHGSVYVHSYVRKDGTFVSSYTRRR